MYKAKPHSLEHCKNNHCIVLSIILNNITYFIKLWMGSVYTRNIQQITKFVPKTPCCITFCNDYSETIVYNNLHMCMEQILGIYLSFEMSNSCMQLLFLILKLLSNP